MKATDKKTDKRMSGERPITLIVTIYPPKKDKRRIVVSAAPEGEMPLIIDGLFPERHAILDRAYGLVLRRDPQVVTVKNPLPASPADAGEGSDQVVGEDAAPTPSPSPVETGEGSAVALSDISSTEELPEIEGDEPSPPTPLPESGEGSEEEDEHG